MGTRGPLPDPKSRNSLLGKNTLRRHVKRPRERGRVKMPPSLAADPVAVDFWTTHASRLVADGRLMPSSVDAFALLCQLHAEVKRLEQLIRVEGYVLAGGRKNPTAAAFRDMCRLFVSTSKEFGMTAVSRERLPVATEPQADEDPEAVKLKAFLA